jgi:glycerol kinase
MQKDLDTPLEALKVDGGMVYNDLLMQFQADILGLSIVRPQVVETSSLGAAYAAGYAVGFWENIDTLRQNWKVDKEWKPGMTEEKREELYRNWKRAVERTFNWVEL